MREQGAGGGQAGLASADHDHVGYLCHGSCSFRIEPGWVRGSAPRSAAGRTARSGLLAGLPVPPQHCSPLLSV
jgi:hypothetical protein